MNSRSEESIFQDVVSQAPDKRQSFLAQACGGDDQLKARVEALISAHENPTSLFDSQDDNERTEAAAQSLDICSGMLIGKYKLLQKIGEGGFGVVFMAEQLEPVRRQVALKIIKPGMDTKAVVARFEAERQALAMMDHPNIARVFDGGAVGDDTNGSQTPDTNNDGPTSTAALASRYRPYFVMELVKGVPITEYCDKNNLSTQERLELFIDVCAAVQHAHLKGIIHRDIKPSNVMITLHDGIPVVKVIDFGVAKAVHQRLTERTMFTEYGQMIGTPQYMSPEQAEMSGLDVDTRSDVYSLGVLLYELLTGTTPLETKSLRTAGYMEMQRLIREQEPPMPSRRLSTAGDELTVIAKHRSVSPDRLHREIKGDLDWIVMKGLEKERSRRYESAIELSRDIRRMMNNEPVEAGPPTIGYRLRKFIRRNNRQLAIAASMVVLASATAIWGYLSWSDAKRKTDLANNQLYDAVDALQEDVADAKSSSIGDPSKWVVASSSRGRVQELVDLDNADSLSVELAVETLLEFDAAQSDRKLAEYIEEVVLFSSTHDDLESWLRMEREFEQLFRERGIDFERMKPGDIAQKIRNARASEYLVDALELWIGTKGHLAVIGGPGATSESMQPMADAILAADKHPVRTGIRNFIYVPGKKTPADVEKFIEGVDIRSLSPRTRSWLSSCFAMVGESDRGDRIMLDALHDHPDNVMLNADYAYGLRLEGRWEEAVRYYMRCTALRRDVSGVWRGLGICLRNLDELEESELALRRACELEPGYLPMKIDLVETILKQERFREAKKLAEQIVGQDDMEPAAYGCLGRALMGLEQFDDALMAFEKCKSLLQEKPYPPLPVDKWIDECEKTKAER